MATLNGGITSTSELIRISGTPPAPGTFVTIDDEAMKVNGAARGANGRSFTRDYLSVDRGVAGTTKATHSNGATLTPYYPDAPGGGSGGVTVDNGSDPPAAVTTLVVPGAVITGDSALLAVIFSTSDPGAVGAGVLWLQDKEDGHYLLWVRDADDANWLTPANQEGLRYATTGGGTTIVSQYAANANAAQLSAKSDDEQTQAGITADAANGVLMTMGEPLGGYFQVLIPPLATELQMWDAAHGMPFPGISFLMGTADPSAASGVVAAAGSFYSRNNAGAGELWFKTGAGDTAWTELTP